MILNWTGNTQLPIFWQHLALYKEQTHQIVIVLGSE